MPQLKEWMLEPVCYFIVTPDRTGLTDSFYATVRAFSSIQARGISFVNVNGADPNRESLGLRKKLMTSKWMMLHSNCVHLWDAFTFTATSYDKWSSFETLLYTHLTLVSAALIHRQHTEKITIILENHLFAPIKIFIIYFSNYKIIFYPQNSHQHSFKLTTNNQSNGKINEP